MCVFHQRFSLALALLGPLDMLASPGQCGPEVESRRHFCPSAALHDLVRPLLDLCSRRSSPEYPFFHPSILMKRFATLWERPLAFPINHCLFGTGAAWWLTLRFPPTKYCCEQTVVCPLDKQRTLCGWCSLPKLLYQYYGNTTIVMAKNSPPYDGRRLLH